MTVCPLYTLRPKSKWSDKQRHPTPYFSGNCEKLSWNDVQHRKCNECKHLLTFDTGLTDVFMCKAKGEAE